MGAYLSSFFGVFLLIAFFYSCGPSGEPEIIDNSIPPNENGEIIEPDINAEMCNRGYDSTDSETIDTTSVFELSINFELNKVEHVSTTPTGEDTITFIESSNLYFSKFAVLIINKQNPEHFFPVYIAWNRGDTSFSITSTVKYNQYEVVFLNDISNLCSITPNNYNHYATNMVKSIKYRSAESDYTPGDDAIKFSNLDESNPSFTITWY